jgi:hypothetical protein
LSHPSFLGEIKQAVLLDMPGIRANRDVWQTKKAVLNHFRDFQAIEVLFSHLTKKSASMLSGYFLPRANRKQLPSLPQP